jgi:hypothetical protein
MNTEQPFLVSAPDPNTRPKQTLFCFLNGSGIARDALTPCAPWLRPITAPAVDVAILGAVAHNSSPRP